MTLFSGKGIVSREFPEWEGKEFGNEYCVPD